MDRYIGLDAHASSCTAAVVGPSGRRLQSQVLETNAGVLISFLKTIPKPRHLCLEEGTHAGWLYEVLAPHVQEIVVAGVGGQKNRGPKSDKRDGFALAEELRIGAIKTRVYKGAGEFGQLRDLSRAYTMVVSDSVRVQNRIKSLYRSRGIPTSGTEVYAPAARGKWLRKLPSRSHPLAKILYVELDAVRDLQKRAEKEMLIEARKHKITRILMTCPGMGPIRVAQMLPIVVTPCRFSSKRSFWAYGGLAIVTRSSSDWARARDGSWVWAAVQQTRGLNRNYNRTLKRIFKGAATTVIMRAGRDDPLYRHYQQLLDGGTKPNLAKLSIARQIASIVLTMWRSEEVYNPAKLKKTT
ncbi:transposase [Candidatus Eisenbacteria bacterium]|uniref:Transposase n=1 Tax=Eiseniibacteriota bacterium TaxID=2212470 RepID=A0ABV6YMC8_UNCEI